MTSFPADPVAVSVAEEPREFASELTLRGVWTAVRRRWWVVATALVLITALGTWRTINQRDMYRSATRVQVAQQQSPIPGMQMPQQFDYRIDRKSVGEGRGVEPNAQQ